MRCFRLSVNCSQPISENADTWLPAATAQQVPTVCQDTPVINGKSSSTTQRSKQTSAQDESLPRGSNHSRSRTGSSAEMDPADKIARIARREKREAQQAMAAVHQPAQNITIPGEQVGDGFQAHTKQSAMLQETEGEWA